MGKVTFANSKINETISGESQKYQSHITSADVFDTGSLAAETADNLKDSAAYVEAIPEPAPKRKVETSGFTAHAMGENTIVEFDLENAEDLAGYETQDEGATAPASFKADGEPIEGDAIETFGSGEKWHAVLSENLSGKTIEMILTPDPAKADEVDQTPVVESATVEG